VRAPFGVTLEGYRQTQFYSQSGSQLTLRWREMDSNLQFRARRNLGIPLELN
jgi:hypothetical protein